MPTCLEKDLPMRDCRVPIRYGSIMEFSNWLAYDRFTAKAAGVKTIPTLEAPALSVEGSPVHSIQDLIKSTERGILVTNFWYIRR